ncbi:leucine-rich repeat-containing protein 56-like [Ptychodera flava]|uniref:leucine-rich repeat-containing protein 56-like n=1 Tax=Ptychodera flava TaxID=63121 RepID=UPI003969DEFD
MDGEVDEIIDLSSRPTTSYQRKSVHITEFRDYRVNPEPIVVEETELLLEEYLSPTKLRTLTGVEDLEDVSFLEMRVDTTETSLGNFGTMLPRLKHLKLNNSIIASVRDLGTSLRNLKVLWMARCGLTDLDGISSMSSLQELYLAYNELSDVSPCSMLDNLQLLDLEGNNIDDISHVEFLALCSNLNTLTLEGNPVCITPQPGYDPKVSGQYDYRLSVKKAIPNLVILDEEALEVVFSSLGSKNVNTSTDWLIVNHAIKEGSEESLEATENGRPGSSKGRPSSQSGRRPWTSASRPGTNAGNRPGTSANRRLGTATTDRPDSSGSDIQVLQDDSSDLTHGSSIPLCGNPVRALRNRKKTSNTEIPYTTLPSFFAQYHHTPEHTYDEEEDTNESKEDVYAELREWKKDYEKLMAERRKAAQPQVLKISHSDDSHSDTDDDDDDGNDTGIEVSPPDSVSPDSAERVHSPPTTLTPRQPGPSSSPRLPSRPKTAGDFRIRRYKPIQPIDQGNDARVRNVRMTSDEEVLVTDREEVHSPGTPPGLIYGAIDERPHPGPIMAIPSAVVLGPIEERPYSGPVIGNRKFQSVRPIDKTQPKIIDRNQPIVRSSTRTPPSLAQRFAGLSRPSTAKAAMQRLPNKPMKPV